MLRAFGGMEECQRGCVGSDFFGNGINGYTFFMQLTLWEKGIRYAVITSRISTPATLAFQ
jgi:hypothetical protein